ncbi:MAG: 16S rRNA (uracil(1498)-N(3))-methyltransferase [Chloroflexi bacterium]|jgi:16S rRNA (uracil1498-N3)-methyltransferase|nr:16S rRNA (uracil(1498)-N(3))-methyltransferase [Anaerolineaceae bacterium]NMB88288.1 16S rRNA (uracil(1498)-N(3))-methyltransferase [Chloroflexota bacterium]
MHRFFLPPEAIGAERVRFPEETARQIRRVLRLRPGQQVVVLDGGGREFVVELDEVTAGAVSGQVRAQAAAGGEPAVQLVLYLCLTQREKFEWMLQKCTELGAAAFVPVLSSRALVQAAGEAEHKRTRWQRILQEAAEQSGRGRVPQLYPALSYADALADAGQHPARLILWEEERAHALQTALRGLAGLPRLAVLIGPEGGLSPAEVDQAQAAGFTAVTLGRRILRMETAAMAATALILYEWGEMG